MGGSTSKINTYCCKCGKYSESECWVQSCSTFVSGSYTSGGVTYTQYTTVRTMYRRCLTCRHIQDSCPNEVVINEKRTPCGNSMLPKKDLQQDTCFGECFGAPPLEEWCCICKARTVSVFDEKVFSHSGAVSRKQCKECNHKRCFTVFRVGDKSHSCGPVGTIEQKEIWQKKKQKERQRYCCLCKKYVMVWNKNKNHCDCNHITSKCDVEIFDEETGKYIMCGGNKFEELKENEKFKDSSVKYCCKCKTIVRYRIQDEITGLGDILECVARCENCHHNLNHMTTKTGHPYHIGYVNSEVKRGLEFKGAKNYHQCGKFVSRKSIDVDKKYAGMKLLTGDGFVGRLFNLKLGAIKGARKGWCCKCNEVTEMVESNSYDYRCVKCLHYKCTREWRDENSGKMVCCGTVHGTGYVDPLTKLKSKMSKDESNCCMCMKPTRSVPSRAFRANATGPNEFGEVIYRCAECDHCKNACGREFENIWGFHSLCNQPIKKDKLFQKLVNTFKKVGKELIQPKKSHETVQTQRTITTTSNVETQGVAQDIIFENPSSPTDKKEVPQQQVVIIEKSKESSQVVIEKPIETPNPQPQIASGAVETTEVNEIVTQNVVVKDIGVENPSSLQNVIIEDGKKTVVIIETPKKEQNVVITEEKIAIPQKFVVIEKEKGETKEVVIENKEIAQNTKQQKLGQSKSGLDFSKVNSFGAGNVVIVAKKPEEKGDDLYKFLKKIGLTKYYDKFVSESLVFGDLDQVGADDLVEIGIKQQEAEKITQEFEKYQID